MQKLQNDNGCKSLRLTIFLFLVARGFGPYLGVSATRWKDGTATLKGCKQAGDHSRVLRASCLSDLKFEAGWIL